MDLAAVHTLYNALGGDGCTFLYSGRFHDEHTAHLIALGERLVEDAAGERTVRNKLGFVMVESYQNIIRHRAPLDPVVDATTGRSLFMLRAKEQNYEVVAMNAMLKEESASLRVLLERIHDLDLKQLKELFLRGLQNDTLSQRGGAGLGLIEMARRSGHGLWHRLAPLDAAHVLFTLRIMIGGSTPVSDAATLEKIHAMVGLQDILLLCKGRLSAGIQSTVVEMISKDLDEGSGRADVRTRSYLAATEWVEGVSLPHAEPFVAIARRAEGHAFIVGTDVEHTMADAVEKEVAAINAMAPQDMQRAYRDALLGRNISAGPGSLGVGSPGTELEFAL